MSSPSEKTFVPGNALAWREDGVAETKRIDLIAEEPLSIRIEGKPFTVVMRTPGDEIAHAAGLCLAEGIVDRRDDLAAIGFCDDMDTNVVTVTVSEPCRRRIKGHLEREGFVSRTSCGICGRTVVDEIVQNVHPFAEGSAIDPAKALACLETLSAHQPLRDKTRAAHAAAVYDPDYTLIASAEDVGRHNAVDKVTGRLFLSGDMGKALFMTLSSRISYELVQKAARAGIPAIFSISRPTALAVNLGERLNMTLACHNKSGGMLIWCGKHRLGR